MSEPSETFKRLEKDPQGGSHHLIELLESYFHPFLVILDRILDKRLIRTLLQCLVAIIRLRNTPQALWLSELGSYLEGYEGYSASAAAGTKRVGKLLRSMKWTVDVIERFLLEKAESEKLEGLCPVLSSKAKRRNRTKRGSCSIGQRLAWCE